MKFGRVAVSAAEGLVLAHAVKATGVVLRKGDIVTSGHVTALENAGVQTVVGARLEPGDVEENQAALLLAKNVAGENVRADCAFTGRCNLFADVSGLACVDCAAIDAINAVHESITVATLHRLAPVGAGQMVATVKIIPFAVGAAQLARACAASVACIRVAPFRPLAVGVISTMLPTLKSSTVDKTLDVLATRLAPANAKIALERRVGHDSHAVARALDTVRDLDLVVVFGASAISDRRDVVPVGIELAGGEIEHLGMPVDPGNLLLLGHLYRGECKVPLIGAPGCARSVKENGFDFVLRRLLAGVPVSGDDLRRMGVGGLLSEIASRPQLREGGVAVSPQFGRRS